MRIDFERVWSHPQGRNTDEASDVFCKLSDLLDTVESDLLEAFDVDDAEFSQIAWTFAQIQGAHDVMQKNWRDMWMKSVNGGSYYVFQVLVDGIDFITNTIKTSVDSKELCLVTLGGLLGSEAQMQIWTDRPSQPDPALYCAFFNRNHKLKTVWKPLPVTSHDPRRDHRFVEMGTQMTVKDRLVYRKCGCGNPWQHDAQKLSNKQCKWQFVEMSEAGWKLENWRDKCKWLFFSKL